MLTRIRIRGPSMTENLVGKSLRSEKPEYMNCNFIGAELCSGDKEDQKIKISL